MNTTANETKSTIDQQAAFRGAVIGLRDTHEKFAKGELKSVQHGDQREQHLSVALAALASFYDVNLQGPLQIDSNGEYSLVVIPKNGGNPAYGCGPFGEFAEVLNPYSPRQGIAPGTLSDHSGWCRINHFSVERLVLDQATARGI